MKTIVIKNNDNERAAIRQTTEILEENLKKGDVILIKPRLRNIRLKIRNFPSFIIGAFTRGITHSCLYLGKGKVLEIGTKFYDKGIKKISLEKLLRIKYASFRGLTIYIVKPKYYKTKHRNLVFKIAINNFLKKSKELTFSYIKIFKEVIKAAFHNSKISRRKEKLTFKKVWNCSDLVAYVLKKSGAKIGKRRTKFFAPSTFLFSKHFKTKKKVVLK